MSDTAPPSIEARAPGGIITAIVIGDQVVSHFRIPAPEQFSDEVTERINRAADRQRVVVDVAVAMGLVPKLAIYDGDTGALAYLADAQEIMAIHDETGEAPSLTDPKYDQGGFA